MEEKVLVDTGPLVAILSESDEHHKACTDELRNTRAKLVTCWPVLTEAAWLLRAYPRAVEKLLAACRDRVFELEALERDDLDGLAAVLSRYRNLGIQLADAALVHLANREGIETIFTLNRRDFGVMRLNNGKRLRMVPGGAAGVG